MEFRSSQDHQHQHHHHHHHNNDQMRAAFNHQQSQSQSQSPGGATRPRPLHSIAINTTHNGTTNTSTLTSPNSCTNTTPTTTTTTTTNTTAPTTQTLDNFQQARPLQQVQLQPIPQPSARDLEPTKKPGQSSSSSSSAAVKYRECLKNHAASVGGSVFDGCGEFMPSGEEGSLEALKCAACSCHRNFHRKESDSIDNLNLTSNNQQLALYSPGTRRSSTAATTNPLHITPPLLPSPTGLGHHISPHHHYTHPHHHHHHFPHHHKFPIVQPMNVAYGGGGESSSEELNATADNSAPPPHAAGTPYGLSRKRFRTKFTQEQKDKMLEFADRVGWRFQKQDEEEVERFCAEVGVKRQVLKVWMHNNKSSNVKATKQQVDHVSMLMGNMGNSSSSAPRNDVIMNPQVSDEAVDEDDGLD